jgi:uncharacterized protein (TIGR04255 family)
MVDKIPVRLKKEPLIEAIWEIRFSPAKPLVAGLLPGILFESSPKKFDNVVKLSFPNLPDFAMEHDPNLRYIPRIRLEGGNLSVQVGNRVLSLSCRRPYCGWSKFSSEIRQLIKVVRKTELIDRLERFSLKYIDLIELQEPIGRGSGVLPILPARS